jgi:hypothetical protein
LDCEDALGITGVGVLPITRVTPSGEGGQVGSGRASTGPGAGYDSPTTDTEKGGMGEGNFGIKDLKSIVSKTSRATDHDSQTIENSEREFGMRNRVKEGECKLGKRNYTEDESGMKNRNVTWESKGEFRKRNVGPVRHSELSWESEGKFGKRKASTTRNPEPNSRTPRISGSVSKGLAGDALLSELKTSIVPKLGPRGNPAGKLGLGSDLKSAPRIQTPKISDPIRKGLAGDAVLKALEHPIEPRLGPRGNSFDKLGPHDEERPENSGIRGSTDLEGLSKDLRERKATKSDDAPVPLSMCEEHLISDGAWRWTARERRKLEPACDTLRTRMLIGWKGRVSSSFRAWLNEEYADTFGIKNKRWGGG